MKVILLDYVYKHGVAGEVIDVADGFARNFLIPKRLAVKATAGELKRASSLREQATVRRATLENQMNELARQIDGVELVFGRRAAATGKLFGSVTTMEIAEALYEKTGVDINRRRISQQPLREVGTHEVPVRLGSEISPTLRITIVPEQELAEYLQRLEGGDGEEAATEEDGSVVENAVEAVEAAAETVVEAVQDVVETVTGQADDEEEVQS
ncbi:MAG: 50S ribosomal protein L9 [Anaerolineae bacterium]|nr:50S ribosomal protein L9 [Anaerolineae bacterium]